MACGHAHLKGSCPYRVQPSASTSPVAATGTSDPRLGPARRGPPRPRGSAFGLVPGEVLAARIISARTPVPYPRMKTGSRVPDARLMASKILHPSDQTYSSFDEYRQNGRGTKKNKKDFAEVPRKYPLGIDQKYCLIFLPPPP